MFLSLNQSGGPRDIAIPSLAWDCSILQMKIHPRKCKMITCSAAGEANNTEVLWLWQLLGNEISMSETHVAGQI